MGESKERKMTDLTYHQTLCRWDKQFVDGLIKPREFAAIIQALLDTYGPRFDEDGAALVSVRVRHRVW